MKTTPDFRPSRILCPLDFSELSGLALKYAAAGARAFDATLIVIHAPRFELPAYFTPEQISALLRQQRIGQKQARSFLEAYVRKRLGAQAGQIPLQFEIADAHPVDAILAAGRRRRADLIVMGTHGRSGARRLWLGSVAENVIRQAEVPVFVVRQKQHEFINPADPQSVPALKTILCPVNFTESSHTALRHAASLAAQFHAQLITPCIIEPGDKRSMAEARSRMASWLKETATPGCAAQIVTKKGHAAGQIVSLTTTTRADLVVLGAQRHPSFQNWLSGDTAEIVLRQATAPVLIVTR